MASSSKKKKKKKAGFSAVDMTVLTLILDNGGLYCELAAFVVLACHTTGKGDNPHTLSTAGVAAIAKKTGMIRSRAENAVKWLTKREIITPLKADPEIPRSHQLRWHIKNSNEDLVYLPHSLVQGLGNRSSPLCQIYEKSGLGPLGVVNETRTHTLWLLLNLYRVHSIQAFGGIRADCCSRGWEVTDEPDGFSYGELYYTPFTRKGRKASADFVRECFGRPCFEKLQCDGPDSFGSFVFRYSLDTLFAYGFIYEVLQCWDSDPREYQDATLLFPLHVFDRSTTDPFVSKEVNKIVRRFFDDEELSILGEGSKKIFYCPSEGIIPVIMGSLRLRFHPGTNETIAGFSAQKSKHEEWCRRLEAQEKMEMEINMEIGEPLV